MRRRPPPPVDRPVRRRLRLHVRLALALLALLLPLGAFCIWIAERGAQAYSVEASQRRNASIGMYMAENAALVDADGRLDVVALATLAEHVMTINPSVEVYLLDTAGRVLAQPEIANHVARPQVALAPIERFLDRLAAGDLSGSTFGDDPLRPGRPQPFSAFPLEHEGRRVGYVYAVIGSPRDRALIASVRSSYALSTVAATIAAVLATAAVGGSLALVTLTRRLRRLTRRVEAWHDAEGGRAAATAPPGGDEIDALAGAYDAMAARLRAQYDALEDKERARRELVANVSHDLRTPLTTLKGYLETLQLGRGRLQSEAEHGYIDIAARHAARLERLLADLFELATLDSGERRAHPERFSMLELAQDALQDVEIRSAERDVRLSIRPPRCATPELDVCADIALVHRAIENLLDNALRHVEPGGRVEIRLDRRGDRVRVAVIDDGAGMAPDVLERLFEPGFRARGASGDDGGAHAGLGLAIVHGVVAMHGGRVRVRSVPDAGSAFTFDLPAAVAVAVRQATRPGRRRPRSEAPPHRAPLPQGPAGP